MKRFIIFSLVTIFPLMGLWATTTASQATVSEVSSSLHHTAAYQALAPHYLRQEGDCSCSLATATIIVNAMRAKGDCQVSPVTQQELLEKTGSQYWREAIQDDGDGITLDEFSSLLKRALNAFGIEKFSLEVVHVNTNSNEDRHRLNQILIGMAQETVVHTFVVANFELSMLIPFPIAVGHLSPIGDYIPGAGNVFLFDVASELSGPYWVTEQALLDSMNTRDLDSNPPSFRGYLVIKF